MTTITVKIEREKDLSQLTELMGRLGLSYDIEENAGLVYTGELKNLLDSRYAEYQQGIEMVTAEESRQKIQAMLAGKND